jgi:hypothetical protein
VVREHGHVLALDTVAMATAKTGGPPHRREQRLPPAERAWSEAELLRANSSDETVDFESPMTTMPDQKPLSHRQLYTPAVTSEPVSQVRSIGRQN